MVKEPGFLRSMAKGISHLILPLYQHLSTFSSVIVLPGSRKCQCPVLQHSEYPACICITNRMFKFTEEQSVSDEIYAVGEPIIRVLFLSFLRSCCSGKLCSNLRGQSFDFVYSWFPLLEVGPLGETLEDPAYKIQVREYNTTNADSHDAV
jgi:hypothetical protein